jgi:hypothetical protein
MCTKLLCESDIFLFKAKKTTLDYEIVDHSAGTQMILRRKKYSAPGYENLWDRNEQVTAEGGAQWSPEKHTGKRETESGVARVLSPSVDVVAALIFVLTPSCG